MDLYRFNISVCMATYNGEKYIEEQISSILSQLNINDELIIVDDCSNDKTIDLIKKFNSRLIRIYINQKNLGCNKTFEKAINFASKDIIFLADQDDIWHPKKVKTIIAKFQKNPKISLCLSEANIINKSGEYLGFDYYQKRGYYRRGFLNNVIKSKYLGCSMAFKRNFTKKYVLPFPKNISGHDIWIGLINEIYGHINFINKPLIKYRRHGKNLSLSKHSNFLQMMIWRLNDLTEIIKRIKFNLFNF